MRRLVALAPLALVVAACGSGGKGAATEPANTAFAPVTKPLQRAMVVRLKGGAAGTARIRRTANGQRTAVEVTLEHAATDGERVELARGSCGAPAALRTAVALGPLHGTRGSWTTAVRLARLANGPLAVVVRSAAHAVAACGNVPRG
jgi:hypothetical protein